jgi:hypothetical protein
MAPTLVKDQFRNDSGGVAGAVIIENNQAKAIPVQPGDTVWLSEDEQALTANAPKRQEDNPFINGTFTLVTEAQHIKHARPLRPQVPDVQETGAPPVAVAEPEQGKRAPGEEVATPAAVPSAVAAPEEEETEVAADGRTIVKRANPASKS